MRQKRHDRLPYCSPHLHEILTYFKEIFRQHASKPVTIILAREIDLPLPLVPSSPIHSFPHFSFLSLALSLRWIHHFFPSSKIQLGSGGAL